MENIKFNSPTLGTLTISKDRLGAVVFTINGFKSRYSPEAVVHTIFGDTSKVRHKFLNPTKRKQKI